jgi:modulator of FtsH protease
VNEWENFFLGELSAAAALAGLLFVAVSVNQTRILALGRMADRGLEALVMLLLVIIVASLPLIPGQAVRVLGAEVCGVGLITLLGLIPVQRGYLRGVEAPHRRRSLRMVRCNRFALAVIAAGGAMVLWRGDLQGLYLLPIGILMTFAFVGINAWVLLIEINR